MLASTVGVANNNNAIPCYTGSNAAKDFIELDMGKCPSESYEIFFCPSESYEKQSQNGYAKYVPFEMTTSTTIGTYLQSYKYFKSIPPFKIKQNINSFAQKYVKMHSNKATNVGIHVRRGDHLKHGYLNFPGEQYFKNAMQYFTLKYQDVQFFVASNDISWCKKQPFFKGTHIISENHTAAQDMAILANCDHVIISLGTFGWWAGLLSGGEVVYNADEFVMQHEINKGKVVEQDYYPPEWIKLRGTPHKSQWETYLSASNSQNDYCPKKGSVGALWVQQQYSNVPKTGTCKTQKRIGGKGDGGKIVCLDNIEKNNCVVYSLGSRLDFSFETGVVTELGCEVHTFDCTVGSPSDTPSGISFHPWCIGGSDEKNKYHRT